METSKDMWLSGGRAIVLIISAFLALGKFSLLQGRGCNVYVDSRTVNQKKFYTQRKFLNNQFFLDVKIPALAIGKFGY